MIYRKKNNLGQNIVDKLRKLSKKVFHMKCFTADILRCFTAKQQNLTFGWLAEYSPSNPSMSWILLKFLNILGS